VINVTHVEKEIKVEIQQTQNNISFLSMEITPMENFSLIKRKNSAETKKSHISNFKDLLVIKELKHSDSYLTFSASKQNSIKQIEIIKQTSINDSVVNENLIKHCDSIILDDCLLLNKSITDLSDVSLDSVDSNSIKTDFSE